MKSLKFAGVCVFKELVAEGTATIAAKQAEINSHRAKSAQERRDDAKAQNAHELGSIASDGQLKTRTAARETEGVFIVQAPYVGPATGRSQRTTTEQLEAIARQPVRPSKKAKVLPKRSSSFPRKTTEEAEQEKKKKMKKKKT